MNKLIMFKNFISLILLFFLSLSVFYSKDLKLDASSDSLIMKNDKTYKYFEYYNKIFPSKNFLILAIKTNKKIDDEYISNINMINKKINQIKNIESTFSIVDAPILLLNNLSISDLNNLNIENINNSQNDLNQILDEFSSSPIFKNQIINEDQNLSSIIIYIKENNYFENIKEQRKKNLINIGNLDKIDKKYKIEKEKENKRKEKIINEIRNIIEQKNDNYIYSLGGIDMIVSDTINFVKNDILVFTLAVMLCIIIILFIIYKEIKWVMIPLVSSISAVLYMIGIIGFLKWEITAISSNFISLMLILSISMNIHIINHYKLNYNKNNKNFSLNNTINKMFWPCLYTILTTIVAFGSLLFSNIKPIIDFGNIMIVSLIVIFSTSFIILPILISYFPNTNLNKKNRFSILNNFFRISNYHRNKVLIINFFIFFISVFGIFKLNVENSFINYFKADTEIHQGMKLIDTELGGTTPLDIIIKFKDEKIQIKINNDENYNVDEDIELIDEIEIDDNLFINENENEIWFTNEKLNTIKQIHEYLESKNEIGKVQSIYSLIKMANLINKSPLSIFELSILYNKIPDNYKNQLINPYLSIENNMTKISARIKDSNKIKREELILDINKKIKSEFKNISKFEVNGLLVLYNNMLQSLFSSQIKSFGIILTSIFIMFLILFKSFKLSLIGIVPNIIASVFILGLIGLLGIPLDIMTITIAAITIGIAVDNTIHYIYSVKNNFNNNNLEIIINNTHNNVGNAVLTTSLTIALGFLVLCLSNFVPTILFGLFTALAMIVAMIGVLITLPSLIFKFKI